MKRFSNILFVLEPGLDNAEAFGRALSLANNNQATITAVGIVEPSSVTRENNLLEGMIDACSEQLDSLVRSVPPSRVAIETSVLVGKAFIEIIRDVIRSDRDLVVKAAERPGRRLGGGTDMKLLRKCPSPVWIIHPTQEKAYQVILVALDYEPDNPENAALNAQLLEMAASLALSEFGELHILHAWQLDQENFLRSSRSGLSASEVDGMLELEKKRRSEWLTDCVEKCYERLGTNLSGYLKPTVHLEKGRAQELIPACASNLNAELIVMGTVGRTGVAGMFVGNTAEHVLGEIECSVLTVKPAGFQSPII